MSETFKDLPNISCTYSKAGPSTETMTSKQKLLNPLSYILNEHDDPGSSEHARVEVFLEEALRDSVIEECNLTDLGNADYKNLLEEERNNTPSENADNPIELEIKDKNKDNANSKNSSKKIEIHSIISTKIKKQIYSKDNAVIIEEICPNNTGDGTNVKTLTVLNNAKQRSASDNKECENIQIDKKIKKSQDEPTKNQTYLNINHKVQGKNKKLVQIKPGQKLFRRIPSPVEEVKEEIDIFDFVDEDDEDRKRERRKLKELKERTCCFCQQVFNDPVDVLRHKRQHHNPHKKFLSKLELQPYLLEPPQDVCPVCTKQLHPDRNFKSLYVKHLMTHIDRSESNFKCKVCDRKFKRKDHLQNHERRHF